MSTPIDRPFDNADRHQDVLDGPSNPRTDDGAPAAEDRRSREFRNGYAERPGQPPNDGTTRAVEADPPIGRVNATAPAEVDSDVPTTLPEQVDTQAPPPAPLLVENQEPERPMAVVVPPDRETVLARERERFGGMKLGAGFFGWLTATGLAVLLLAILAAAGVAFGVTSSGNVNQAVREANNNTGTAKTVGLIGAIVLLVILFLAYYAGGYVAGRMARFDGFKQGLGVWLWAIITTGIVAAAAAIAGSKYNILANLNLPRIPVNEGSVTTVGIIAIAAALLAALLGALLGGKFGTRYHRRIDAAGYLDD